MLMISLRNIKNHPGRYLSTMIAIILGVSFFVGTGVLTSTVEDSLNNSIGEAFTEVDTVVRSSESIEVGGFEIRSQVPAELADEVAQVDGVSETAASMRGYAQIVGRDGKVLDGQAYGTNWIEGEGNPYELNDGAAPTGPNEIVVDTGSLEKGDFAIGDEVRVLPLPENQLFTIVGSATYGTDSELAGSENLVAFDFDTAAGVFGSSNVEFIVAQAADGVTPEALVENLNAANLTTGDGVALESISGEALGEEFQDLIGTFTSIISTALSVFALIALGVGVFIIYNTFTILVAQRSREMALLRAIGSTGRQVRTAVLVESVAIGLLASLLGSIAGIGLGWVVVQVLDSFGLPISGALSIPAGTLGIGMVIGTIITVASAYLPARSASKVPPIAALRDVATGESPVGRMRPILGAVGATFGAVAVGISLAGGSVYWLAGAAVAIIVALLVLGPTLVKPMSLALGSPLAAARGMVGELSQQNASRSPKRTANTTAALMVGVLLVSAASVFAASLSSSIQAQLGEQVTADTVIQVDGSASQVGGGLPLTTAEQVAELPGVEAVTPLRSAFGEIDEEFTNISGVAPTQVADTMNLDVLTGSLDELGPDTIATNDTDFAIGDTVSVQFQQSTADLTVVATYDAAELAGPWVVSTEVLDANVSQSLDSLLLIATDGQAETVSAVEGVVASSPIAEVVTAQEYVDDQASSIDLLLNLLYGLLGISVLVAVVGIVNTMSLSIMERTREIGLLRAVGMTRRQIRSSIRYEAGIVAIMGTALGLAVGTFLAWLGVQAIGDALPEFAIPWTTLVIIAVLGMLCGVFAGVMPARRAAKMNVLEAIATD